MTSRFFRKWLLLGCIWVLFAAAVGWNLYSDYRTTEVNERDRLFGLARVVDENIQVQLGATNAALKSIHGDLAMLGFQKGSESLIDQRLKGLTDAMVGVRSLFVLDAHGVVIATSGIEPRGSDFHRREYFREPLKSPNSDGLYLSHPGRSASGDLTITLSKAIQGADGTLGGVIVAALDPLYFITMLNSVLYAPDMRASIFDGDGAVFVSTSMTIAADQEVTMPGGILTEHHAGGQDASVLWGRIFTTDEPRLAGVRTNRFNNPPLARPLVVTLDRDELSVFSEWRKGSYTQGTVALGLMLISAAGITLFQQRLSAFSLHEASSNS